MNISSGTKAIRTNHKAPSGIGSTQTWAKSWNLSSHSYITRAKHLYRIALSDSENHAQRRLLRLVESVSSSCFPVVVTCCWWWWVTEKLWTPLVGCLFAGIVVSDQMGILGMWALVGLSAVLPPHFVAGIYPWSRNSYEPSRKSGGQLGFFTAECWEQHSINLFCWKVEQLISLGGSTSRLSWLIQERRTINSHQIINSKPFDNF